MSNDAKRVFKELQREARPTRRNVEPIHVEGLDQAESVLNQELSRLSLGHASNLIEMIGQVSGFNLPAVLAARFGEKVEFVADDSDFIPF